MLALQPPELSIQNTRSQTGGAPLAVVSSLDFNCGVYSSHGPKRKQVENFIAERFLKIHGATITDFMPHLVTLERHGQVSAVAGLRTAASGSLFTEVYLNTPLEQILSKNKEKIDAIGP